MNSINSLALVLLIVAACNAFSPAPVARSSTSLSSAFDGKNLDPAQNAYARGGKNSWDFELDSMFVEEPKKKKAAPKKAVAKKPVAKKVAPKKAVAAKKPAAKAAPAANPFSFFSKPAATAAKPAAKKAAAKKPVAKKAPAKAAPAASPFSFFSKPAPAAAKPAAKKPAAKKAPAKKKAVGPLGF